MGFILLAIIVGTNIEKIVEEANKELKPETEVNWERKSVCVREVIKK